MSSKVIIQYIENLDKPFKKKDGFRLYIKDGLVQNTDIEEIIKSSLDLLTAVRIRQTGKGSRILHLTLE